MGDQEPKTVDEYLAGCSASECRRLESVRAAIREAAPQATEAIRYGIPTFVLEQKNLVHFAASKNHVGFYPEPSAIAAFAAELSPYKTGKGSVQLPNDKPLPLQLIKRMVEFRVGELMGKNEPDKQ